MTSVKKPITVRMDPELLAQVRLIAERDNRSLTNFIETALRQQLPLTIQGTSGPVSISRPMNGNKSQ
jgi:hypothetical protein